MLHQLPRSEDDPPNKVKAELVVLDSGKVRVRISKSPICTTDTVHQS